MLLDLIADRIGTGCAQRHRGTGLSRTVLADNLTLCEVLCVGYSIIQVVAHPGVHRTKVQRYWMCELRASIPAVADTNAPVSAVRRRLSLRVSGRYSAFGGRLEANLSRVSRSRAGVLAARSRLAADNDRPVLVMHSRAAVQGRCSMPAAISGTGTASCAIGEGGGDMPDSFCGRAAQAQHGQRCPA